MNNKRRLKTIIINRLKHRIDVYKKVKSETQFGELTFDYEKTSTVWAEILPTTVGTKEEEVDGNSMRQIVSHKIIIRKNAIKDPRNDMYFIFQGQKYEVKYFMPHYQKNDLIEFYCKLIIEGEDDYGN